MAAELSDPAIPGTPPEGAAPAPAAPAPASQAPHAGRPTVLVPEIIPSLPNSPSAIAAQMGTGGEANYGDEIEELIGAGFGDPAHSSWASARAAPTTSTSSTRRTSPVRVRARPPSVQQTRPPSVERVALTPDGDSLGRILRLEERADRTDRNVDRNFERLQDQLKYDIGELKRDYQELLTRTVELAASDEHYRREIVRMEGLLDERGKVKVIMKQTQNAICFISRHLIFTNNNNYCVV